MDEIKKNQKKGGGEKLFYEQLVQVGDMHDSGNKFSQDEAKKCKEILKEYAEDFQQRNPNLYVFNAVIHMDEATPHLHIDYIPLAKENYKQGLKVRNSLSRALQEQGIEKGEGNVKSNEFTNWRQKEIEEIEKVCQKYNVKTKHLNSEKRDYLTPDQYREAGRLADKQIEQLKKDGNLLTPEQAKEIVKKELNKNSEKQIENFNQVKTKETNEIEAKNQEKTEKPQILSKITENQSHISPVNERKESQTINTIAEVKQSVSVISLERKTEIENELKILNSKKAEIEKIIRTNEEKFKKPCKELDEKYKNRNFMEKLTFTEKQYNEKYDNYCNKYYTAQSKLHAYYDKYGKEILQLQNELRMGIARKKENIVEKIENKQINNTKVRRPSQMPENLLNRQKSNNKTNILQR